MTARRAETVLLQRLEMLAAPLLLAPALHLLAILLDPLLTDPPQSAASLPAVVRKGLRGEGLLAHLVECALLPLLLALELIACTL